MQSKTGPQIMAAYKRVHKMLTDRGLKPKLQKLENEASKALQEFMQDNAIDYKLDPPQIHRRNAAERAIRTFKNHFIVRLSSTNRNFQLNLWDKLLPQALISLNLLRGLRINSRISSHTQLHGVFDYNRTPLAPPGTKVLVHEKPNIRETWAPYGVKGWYIGPALHHYRCYRVWVWATNAERVADTMAWFPQHVTMPFLSSSQAAIAAARDLVSALNNPTSASPICPLATSQREQLDQLADIFTQHTANTPPQNSDGNNRRHNRCHHIHITTSSPRTTTHNLRLHNPHKSTPLSDQPKPNTGTHSNISEGGCIPCTTSEGGTTTNRPANIRQSNMEPNRNGRATTSTHIRPRHNQCRPTMEESSGNKTQTKNHKHEIGTKQNSPLK
jgi:hypothetical protein